MSHSFATDLRSAGIAFDSYRDLARPIQDGQGASRWPLIAATDQVLVAQRWKREALAPQALPGKVTQLPTSRTPSQPGMASDWFLADSHERAASGPSSTGKSRAN